MLIFFQLINTLVESAKTTYVTVGDHCLHPACSVCSGQIQFCSSQNGLLYNFVAYHDYSRPQALRLASLVKNRSRITFLDQKPHWTVQDSWRSTTSTSTGSHRPMAARWPLVVPPQRMLVREWWIGLNPSRIRGKERLSTWLQYCRANARNWSMSGRRQLLVFWMNMMT